jgi:death on curing protein
VTASAPPTAAKLPEPLWVPRAAVGVIHAQLVSLFGGLRGVRDGGLVESALDRPRNRWAYETGVDLADLAACYCVGLTKNHDFVDGNKRTAFQTMFVFLDINGHTLTADEAEVAALMVEVATGETDELALAAWVREHI